MRSRIILAIILCLSMLSSVQAQIFRWGQPQDSANTYQHPLITPFVWLMDHRPESEAAAAAQLKAIKDPKMRGLHLWADNHQIFQSAPSTQPLLLDASTATAFKDSTRAAKLMPALRVVMLDNEDAWCYWNLNDQQRQWASTFLNVPVPVNPWDDANICRFNAACSLINALAVRNGILSPYRKYQPNAEVSSFGAMLADYTDNAFDSNGHQFVSGLLPGTVQSPGFYGEANPQAWTPWSYAIYSLNILRMCERHGPGQTWPWYSGRDYGGSIWAGTPYWDEFVRQAFVTSGIQGFLFDPGMFDAAPQLGAVINDTLKSEGGALLDDLVAIDVINSSAKFVVIARANKKFFPTKIAGRVSFAPGVTSAVFNVLGRDFNVQQPDAGMSGAWFSWSAN